MKVIFLDIDGVLNVIPQGRDQYGSIFHPQFEDNLQYLIEQTKANIVISSTWRYSGLKVMQNMWRDRGLPGNIINITPIHFNSRYRGEEIDAWLKENQVDNYVIIDDDNDMLPEQMLNFVQTYGNHEHTDAVDFGYGLTKECTLKAIGILNKI
jgi:hypothetical protein